MTGKTLVPNDFRDFLSIISFVGFVAITLRFLANSFWLDERLTGFFLLFMGIALIGLGKLFTIRRWVRDGIQSGEVIMILSIITGLSALMIGVLMIANINIPIIFNGVIGTLGLVSATFIIIDYISKNYKR